MAFDPIHWYSESINQNCFLVNISNKVLNSFVLLSPDPTLCIDPIVWRFWIERISDRWVRRSRRSHASVTSRTRADRASNYYHEIHEKIRIPDRVAIRLWSLHIDSPCRPSPTMSLCQWKLGRWAILMNVDDWFNKTLTSVRIWLSSSQPWSRQWCPHWMSSVAEYHCYAHCRRGANLNSMAFHLPGRLWSFHSLR